jgi:dihydroneopterin aldolase/D-erythro-7,8-dihydroneopterin triphosphate epimerase
MMNQALDKVFIRDLLVRGIVGINPDERKNRQDVLVNVTMWVDTRPAAASDDIADAANYKTVSKALIQHIELAQPLLVERLAADLAQICFETDGRIQAVELTVEKPTALRFARSVGLTIYRERKDVLG